MNLRALTASLAGRSREEIEAFWKNYYRLHPEQEPDFVKNPRIAQPYGTDPSDWYEEDEIQLALASGYEWNEGECCWVFVDDSIEDAGDRYEAALSWLDEDDED